MSTERPHIDGRDPGVAITETVSHVLALAETWSGGMAARFRPTTVNTIPTRRSAGLPTTSLTTCRDAEGMTWVSDTSGEKYVPNGTVEKLEICAACPFRELRDLQGRVHLKHLIVVRQVADHDVVALLQVDGQRDGTPLVDGMDLVHEGDTRRRLVDDREGAVGDGKLARG